MANGCLSHATGGCDAGCALGAALAAARRGAHNSNAHLFLQRVHGVVALVERAQARAAGPLEESNLEVRGGDGKVLAVGRDGERSRRGLGLCARVEVRLRFVTERCASGCRAVLPTRGARTPGSQSRGAVARSEEQSVWLVGGVSALRGYSGPILDDASRVAGDK